MITLDIFSDPICPWCYIGKAYLDRALEARPEHPFEIRWRPYLLNTNMPAGGMERRTYLEAKFGGQQGAVNAYLPVTEHAQKAGLSLNLESIGRTPNTVDAHRLIHWGALEGRQTAVISALFRAYFKEGRDIGNAAILCAIATEAGLDGKIIARLLATDQDQDEIIERATAAREMGVTSVPTSIIAGEHVIPGAQPPQTWLQVIDELSTQSRL